MASGSLVLLCLITPHVSSAAEKWRQHPPRGVPKKMGLLASDELLLLLCSGHSLGKIEKCTWAGSVCEKACILAH